jgi:hypothetical protein
LGFQIYAVTDAPADVTKPQRTHII